MTIYSHTPEQTPSAPDSADLIHQQIAEVQSRLRALSKTPFEFASHLGDETAVVLESLLALVTMLAARIEQLQASQLAARLHESQEAQAVEGTRCSHPKAEPTWGWSGRALMYCPRCKGYF